MVGAATRLEALTGVPCVSRDWTWWAVHPEGGKHLRKRQQREAGALGEAMWGSPGASAAAPCQNHLWGRESPELPHRMGATRGKAGLLAVCACAGNAGPGQGTDEGNWSSSASTLRCAAFLILGPVVMTTGSGFVLKIAAVPVLWCPVDRSAFCFEVAEDAVSAGMGRRVSLGTWGLGMTSGVFSGPANLGLGLSESLNEPEGRTPTTRPGVGSRPATLAVA